MAANAMQRSALVFRRALLRSHFEPAPGDLQAAAAAAAAAKSRKRSTAKKKKTSTCEHQKCEYDVFINHRGVDTKRTVAGLLHDRLVQLGLRPFLDNRAMAPGDKLLDSINAGVLQAKVGVAVFSPRYCESAYCLHELAMLVESRKKLIPVFCDVDPADLMADDVDEALPPEVLERFRRALEVAKCNVGFAFDTQYGNWSDLVSMISDKIFWSINERGH